MSRYFSLRWTLPLLVAAFALPFTGHAQSQNSQQTDSVAEAARRAREQKKAADSRPAPVITNDTLKPAPPAQNAPSAPGAGGASAGQPAPAPGASEESDKDTKQKASGELEDAKKQLAAAQAALDLAKRELSLEQDNVYSKANYQNDAAGKTKLDGLQQNVTDKQQTVDTLKARLAELQDKAGVEAPAAPPSSPQS